MKRCLVLLLSALFAGLIGHSQLVNNGATITVQSGATIKCTGAIINNSGGTISNSGTISSDGDLRNEAGGTISGAGLFEATSKFINNGNAFTAIRLKLIGNLNTDSIKSGVGSTYDSLILAKSATRTATLSDAMTINKGIRFDNDDNRLIIEDENLIMGSAAAFESADNNEFVVTNNTGTVTKQSLGSTAFTYEVGFGTGEYNPVSISNTGTSDNISVRCLQNALVNGLTGSPITTHFVKNSWVVTEAVAGGSNLQLIAGWSSADEPALPADFNRAKVGIARYNTGTDWDLPASNVLAASGTGPYTRNRSGITSTGVFAVADLVQVNSAKLNLKVFLQGPYNSGTGLMTDLLRDDPNTGGVDPVIPTTQPYSAGLDPRFTRVGIYDGSSSVNETVNPSVFNVTGNDAIVDWVYISTLDPATPSTKLQTRAALLQRDGDIVDLDGTSPLSLPIDADGNYHILISHRNHLSIRTASAQALSDVPAPVSYNFTTAQTQAFQDGTITTNAAMAQNGSTYLMWAGNANVDAYTRVITQTLPVFITGDGNYILGTILSGQPNATLTGYSAGDINMDRKVRTISQTLPVFIPGDTNFILSTPLGGAPNATRKEHK